MTKRKWVYIQSPVKYDIRCDKCGGTHIAWSEYEHMIWCYDCEIDTGGTEGIFDGPIPIGVMGIFGITFDRYYFKSGAVCREVIAKDGRLVYRKRGSVTVQYKNKCNDDS